MCKFGVYTIYIKVNVKVKFAQEEALKIQRRRRGKAVLFFNFGARWEWVANATPRPLYTRERNPVPIV
jgi:hypothetical protein